MVVADQHSSIVLCILYSCAQRQINFYIGQIYESGRSENLADIAWIYEFLLPMMFEPSSWVTNCVCGDHHGSESGCTRCFTTPMACCDNCDAWLHLKCLGTSFSSIPAGSFHCPPCLAVAGKLRASVRIGSWSDAPIIRKGGGSIAKKRQLQGKMLSSGCFGVKKGVHFFEKVPDCLITCIMKFLRKRDLLMCSVSR